MPVRGYLCPWDAYIDEDGFRQYWPRIMAPGSYLNANGIQAISIDLKTAEQQQKFPAEGWSLVLANVTPPQHNQIMQAADTHEVNAGTTVAEVRAIIGDEATDDVLDGSNIEQLRAYFLNCHRGRINRWKGRN